MKVIMLLFYCRDTFVSHFEKEKIQISFFCRFNLFFFRVERGVGWVGWQYSS